MVSNREGVKHPKRLRYFEGTAYLDYLVLNSFAYLKKLLPKNLSERMEGEEVCFWLFLFDLEGQVLCLRTLFGKGIKTDVVPLKNFFGGLG